MQQLVQPSLQPTINHAWAELPPVTTAATAPTVTRVRWGRLLLLIAGIALLACGAWAGSRSRSTPVSTQDPTARIRVVDGGGDSGVLDADAARRAARAATLTPTAPVARRAAPTGSRTSTTRLTTAAATARRSAVARARAASIRRAAAARRAAVARRAAIRRGGGAGRAAQEQLPYTGASTWIAAVLGLILLGLGVALHVNAVRIGMTAMLYRRGILLRPVDCARLARTRGVGRLRVLVSDALHRLLDAPVGGDFVSTRLA